MSKEMSKGMGNPAVALAVSEVAKTKAGKDVISATTNGLKVLFTIGGVAVTGWYANKKYKEWRAKKYLTENASKKEVQIALLMRGAMDRLPSISLLWTEIKLPDGTDEDLLNLLGRSDVSIDLVSRAYKIIFDSVLLTDINAELSGTELQAFFNGVNATGSDTNTPADLLVPYNKGEEVYVRKKGIVNTRKGVKQANGSWLITNDSQGQFSYAESIGEIYDIKRYANGEIDYIIDDWRINSTFGFAVVNHRDILNTDPSKQ